MTDLPAPACERRVERVPARPSGPPDATVLLVAPALAGRDLASGDRPRLAGHVERQRAGLAAALERRHRNVEVLAVVDDDAFAVEDILGCVTTRRLVAIALAPQYCSGVAGVRRRIEEARRREAVGWDLELVEDWHDHPRLISALASATYEALDAVWSFNSSDRPGYDWALGSKMSAPVVFVGPSWPALEDGAGDPYPALLEDTARRVAERLDLHWWRVARLTPAAAEDDGIADLIGELAERHESDLVVSPVGSIADDDWLVTGIDVEAQRLAQEVAIHIDRARSLNDDPVLIAALADLVVAHMP